MSFTRTIFATALLGTVLCGPIVAPAAADDVGTRPAKHRVHHAAVRVKGFAARRGGGYSYAAGDAINTDNRRKYGGGSLFDPMYDRQTVAGPFDSGFFFDSAMGLHGGDSPYLH